MKFWKLNLEIKVLKIIWKLKFWKLKFGKLKFWKLNLKIEVLKIGVLEIIWKLKSWKLNLKYWNFEELFENGIFKIKFEN